MLSSPQYRIEISTYVFGAESFCPVVVRECPLLACEWFGSAGRLIKPSLRHDISAATPPNTGEMLLPIGTNWCFGAAARMGTDQRYSGLNIFTTVLRLDNDSQNKRGEPLKPTAASKGAVNGENRVIQQLVSYVNIFQELGLCRAPLTNGSTARR